MTREHERSKRRILIVALIVMLAAAAVLFSVNYVKHTARNKANAQTVVESEKNKLEYLMETRLADTKILETLVVSYDGDNFDFEKVAKQIFQEGKAIRSIQLAPMGVVKHVYPLQGNEQAFIDLFATPDRREDVKRARDTDQATMAGPFELKQGGRGLVVNDPVYLPTDDGRRVFWGFSTVVFDVPAIFRDADLEVLEKQGYNYRLWKETSNIDDKLTIVENCSVDLNDAVSAKMEVPNAVWHLDIQPQNGWAAPSVMVSWAAILAVIVTLAMFSLSAYLTSMYRKKELIKNNDIIQEQSLKDPLTGLKNGLGFSKALDEFEATCTPIAVFFMDLDGFKAVNTNHGREVADGLLKEVAYRITECTSEKDIAVRVSADEFVLIVPSEVTEDYCKDLKNRIKDNVEKPYATKKSEIVPQISIGYARFPSDSDEIEGVLKIADMRMYEEKNSKK